MNILVVSQYFYPEPFRVNSFCKELVLRGHNVTVLTGYPQYPYGKIYDGYAFGKPYETEWNGVHIERIKMLPRGKTPLGLLLNCISFVTEGKKWVKKCSTQFDAVYVFEVSPVTVGLPAVAYKEKFGTPIFFNLQDLWPENVEVILGIKNKIVISVINKIVDKIYSASDKILCTSQGFVENLKARGVPTEKLVFWPQFCETPSLDKLSRPSLLSDDTFNIVFTGNVGKAQGLDLLVEAAERLKETKVKWYIVGDGRNLAELKESVSDKKLDDKIVFVGRVSEEEANAYAHYSDCAYLSFVPNKVFNMTIPAKLQTYLACAAPVLAAAEGESAKIVNEAGCGIAVSPEVDALVGAVEKMLSLSDSEIDKMRNNSSDYSLKHFEKNMLVDKFERLVEEI